MLLACAVDGRVRVAYTGRGKVETIDVGSSCISKDDEED